MNSSRYKFKPGDKVILLCELSFSKDNMAVTYLPGTIVVVADCLRTGHPERSYHVRKGFNIVVEVRESQLVKLPRQDQLAQLCMEECGEFSQELSKFCRFGKQDGITIDDQYYPPIEGRIKKEYTDILTTAHILAVEAGIELPFSPAYSNDSDVLEHFQEQCRKKLYRIAINIKNHGVVWTENGYVKA